MVSVVFLNSLKITVQISFNFKLGLIVTLNLMFLSIFIVFIGIPA